MSAQKNIPETFGQARDTITEVGPAPVRRAHGKMRIFLWILVCTVVVIIVFSFGYDFWAYLSHRAAYETARKANIPLSYSDPFFEKWGAKRPASPAENGAVYYEQAFALLPAREDLDMVPSLPFVGDAEMPGDPREPLPRQMVEDMADYLEGCVKPLELIRLGRQAPECYFPIDWRGYETMLPHLAQARAAARLMVMKICLDAEERRPGEAVETAFDALAVARGVGGEPTLIAGLVGVAIRSIVVRGGLERLLSRTDPSAEELLALQSALSNEADALSYRTNFAGEIPMQMDFYDRLARAQLPSAILALGEGRWIPRRYPWAVPFVWLARGYINDNRGRGLELMLQQVDAATKPTPANVSPAWWSRWEQRLMDKRYVFNRMLLPALSRSLRQCELARARLRSAAACVAALRFRSDTGAWPDSLEALVPQYLDKVPLDPFTGGALTCAVDENGIRIYSVGENLTDDGGKPQLVTRPDDIDENEWTRGCDDTGSRVWK